MTRKRAPHVFTNLHARQTIGVSVFTTRLMAALGIVLIGMSYLEPLFVALLGALLGIAPLRADDPQRRAGT